MELYQQQCRWCGEGFVVCRACFRGQRYCGQACRTAGRDEQVRAARQRYRAKEQARQNNRARQSRLRIRRCLQQMEQLGLQRAKVTDQASPTLQTCRRLESTRQQTPLASPEPTDSTAGGWQGSGLILSGMGQCQRCGHRGVMWRVPAGWVRRRHQFVSTPLCRDYG